MASLLTISDTEESGLLGNMGVPTAVEETAPVKVPPGKLTLRLGFSIFAAVLGMFQFGYNTGVINAPQAVIEAFYNETWQDRNDGAPIPSSTLTLLWSFTVAIFAIGGMVGGLLGAWWADKFGRRGGMIINTVFGIVAAALMGFSKMAGSYEMVLIGRLIVGFNCGLYSGLAPLYNSEVAPYNYRGGIGTLNQLAVTVGILISQLLGLEEALGTEELWAVLLGLTAIPPLLQLATLPFIPESPRFLFSKQRDEDTYEALRDLRGTTDVQEEIDEMYREKQQSETETTMNIWEVLKADYLRKPLIIAVVMHLSQQFSGILCIFYYSTSLFINVGLTEDEAKYATLSVGCIMVVMTFITVPLMDRLGRKTLHLSGLCGMFILSIVFTISFSFASQSDKDWIQYFTITSALFIVVFFAIGPGSIPWMIVAELFSQGPRAAAVSIGVMVNWAANFIVGLLFPTMQEWLEELVFVPFTVLLLLFIITLYIILPETKGKTFEEIAALFSTSSSMARNDTKISSQTKKEPSVGGQEGVYRTMSDNSG